MTDQSDDHKAGSDFAHDKHFAHLRLQSELWAKYKDRIEQEHGGTGTTASEAATAGTSTSQGGRTTEPTAETAGSQQQG
ncbi:hypothetical protein IAT40_007526 [Kwoniella sp. CBS 6097]